MWGVGTYFEGGRGTTALLMKQNDAVGFLKILPLASVPAVGFWVNGA